MLAKDIMTKDVISFFPDDKIEKTAKIFIEKRISGAPVVDREKHVVGIISEGDLVFQQKKLSSPAFLTIFDGFLEFGRNAVYEELKKIAANKVEDLMTKHVVTVREDAELTDIATLMVEKNVNRLPVVNDKDELTGLITRFDVIKYLYEGEDNL